MDFSVSTSRFIYYPSLTNSEELDLLKSFHKDLVTEFSKAQSGITSENLQSVQIPELFSFEDYDDLCNDIIYVDQQLVRALAGGAQAMQEVKFWAKALQPGGPVESIRKLNKFHSKFLSTGRTSLSSARNRTLAHKGSLPRNEI